MENDTLPPFNLQAQAGFDRLKVIGLPPPIAPGGKRHCETCNKLVKRTWEYPITDEVLGNGFLTLCYKCALKWRFREAGIPPPLKNFDGFESHWFDLSYPLQSQPLWDGIVRLSKQDKSLTWGGFCIGPLPRRVSIKIYNGILTGRISPERYHLAINALWTTSIWPVNHSPERLKRNTAFRILTMALWFVSMGERPKVIGTIADNPHEYMKNRVPKSKSTKTELIRSRRKWDKSLEHVGIIRTEFIRKGLEKMLQERYLDATMKRDVRTRAERSIQ